MPASTVPSELVYPFASPPGAGEVVKVAPGLLWARLALPFQLNHVNIYLIEDGPDAYAVFDAGLGDKATRAAWQRLVAGPLAGKRLTRLIVSHFHPDHIGIAGWLCAEFGMELYTSYSAYLGCLNISLSPGALDAKPYHDFYSRHGLAAETVSLVTTMGHGYLRMVEPLPPTFTRLVAGDRLTIGRYRFEVLSGDGHAPEQLMLWEPEAKLFLAADQVLAKITPNISVWAVEPEGDPLGLYLRSLKELAAYIAPEALVLPGHQLPFVGIRTRCSELAAHHAERCRLIAAAASDAPRSVADLVPVLFTRALDPHQLSFAFSEVHAHVNAMVRLGELAWKTDDAGIQRVRSTR